jgi:hypothetical protein
MLNSKYNTIKFTVEEEYDQKLPFLDICVRRESDAFKFTIHRKPMSTNRYIKSSSFQVLSQKSAAFHSMANRLINDRKRLPNRKEQHYPNWRNERVQRDVYQEYNREA